MKFSRPIFHQTTNFVTRTSLPQVNRNFAVCKSVLHKLSSDCSTLLNRRAFTSRSSLSVENKPREMSATVASKFTLPRRFKDASYSVWIEFVDIVAKYKPCNLGQGFPDYPVPSRVTQSLAEVSASDNVLVHQYTRGFGHPRLVNALSKLYSKLLNRSLDPLQEIMITCGAYEAIFSAIAGHVQEGDEVIIIEPFYDCYESIVRIFGGIPRFIPLRLLNANHTAESLSSKDWKLDPTELTGLFNDKTKMIILNTPHNPTGKVFARDELQMIADLCKKYNVLCLADEVYEWIVYKPAEHVRIATLPGMWERTLTVGSAGKTFSLTGWKCGWIYGPENLLYNVKVAHQNNIYTYCTPIQEALAKCFETEFNHFDGPECYFKNLAEEIRPKRDAFMKSLIKSGFKPTVPEAGYFVVADWSKLSSKVDLSAEPDSHKDYKFAKWMTKNLQLLGIPPSAFYNSVHKNLGYDYIRFCFFKKEETLKLADDILTNWRCSL